MPPEEDYTPDVPVPDGESVGELADHMAAARSVLSDACTIPRYLTA